jgi:Tfp pilus assembly protein FimV
LAAPCSSSRTSTIAHKQLKAAHDAGYAERAAQDAEALKALTARVEQITANTNKIASDIRGNTDAQAASSHATVADGLSVHGPGAAHCRPVTVPALPAASGQHDTPAGAADAAAGSVPASNGESELAGVPWRWLVGRGEQADLDGQEVRAWREWYQREAAEWEKLRAPLATKPK